MVGETMQKNGKKEIGVLVNALSFIALTVACAVLAVLVIYGMKQPFVQRYTRLFSILATGILFALGCCSVWLVWKRKTLLLRTFLTVYLFLLIIETFTLILQKTGFFEIVKDETALQQYLERAGVWMPLLYIVLQYLQVVVLPIPSVVSTLAGIALFGPLGTIVYSLIGIVLGSLTAFFIGRKLGAKAVAWMIGGDTLKKWQNKLKGKDEVLLTMMFVLPVFPDDVLCFVAGLSSMTTKYFVVMMILSRILSISTTAFSFNLIPFNTWWGLLIWGVLFLILGVVFWFAYKHLDKIHAFFKNRFKRKNKKQ